MKLQPKDYFIQFGDESIPVSDILEYSISSDVETQKQRKKRRSDDVSFSAFGHGCLGTIAAAIPAVPVIAAAATGVGTAVGLGILAGGAVAGGVVGRNKASKKFESNPQNKSLDHSILSVRLNERGVRQYRADTCNFDIYKKCKELDEMFLKGERVREIKSKIHEDEGEKQVEYALKWCLADFKERVVAITKDCESKYRYGCILLGKPDLINEPQEYDHILVSNAGIILIETKHWKGKVEIRSDGKWLRTLNGSDGMTGIESPLFQIQRHETLIKNILPNVPVFSLLCFSNRSVVVKGIDNFAACPVVYVDQMKAAILKILSSATSTHGAPVMDNVDYMVNVIEEYKVNKIDWNEVEICNT